MVPNLPLIRGMQTVVRQKTAKKCRKVRVLESFLFPTVHNIMVSPFGVVSKKGHRECCPIHHLSYLSVDLVNDAIPRDLHSVKYTFFNQAIHMMCQCGQGAELAKYGIKSVFCLLPVAGFFFL